MSVLEYARELIDQGREYDELQSRLESREECIQELQSQLVRGSELNEKVNDLPGKLRDTEK